MNKEEIRTKAHALVDAYLDNPSKIFVKDTPRGVPEWINIGLLAWTFLGRFIHSINCYRIEELKNS